MNRDVQDETIKLIIEEQRLVEMSNLVKRKTGLPVNIWVDDVGIDRDVEHNLPRIKVQNDTADRRQSDGFELSIENDPKILSSTCKLSSKDFQAVRSFVIKYKQALIDHWNQDIDIEDLKEIIEGGNK